MAARSIWNGTVAFGLISAPIKVYSATEDKTVHFHEVHITDEARIEHRRICSKEGKEVPYKDVVKGYEVAKGEYVVLTKDEIAAAAGERSKLIDVETFVCAADIDPVFFDRTYYLGPRDEKAVYRLVRDALEKAGRTAIGRWVFHNREYLVAIRPYEDALAMHTMRFADELVPATDLDLPAAGRKPSGREVEMAGNLVESLHAEFDASAFEDTHRAAVLDMIRRKSRGEEIELAHPDEGSEPDDLAAALEASLQAA